MSHVTCTQANQGDSWLLVVRNQIANLTPSPSFGHNLCFMCPNGSCKPISDMYVPRSFQWYRELLNPTSFDPCNFPLKNTGVPKWEFTWECEGSFPHTLLHFQEHVMWLPGPVLAHTFTNPCFGREPKAKVATPGSGMLSDDTSLWSCSNLNSKLVKLLCDVHLLNLIVISLIYFTLVSSVG
jgi:hypothetical protein